MKSGFRSVLYTIRYLVDHFVSRHVGHNNLFTRITHNTLDIDLDDTGSLRAILVASGISLFDPKSEVEVAVPGAVMIMFSLNPDFDPGERSIEGKYGVMLVFFFWPDWENVKE